MDLPQTEVIKKRETVIKKRNKKTQAIWYIFLLPTVLGIALFILYPVIESLRLSFFHSNGTIESYAGLKNYERVLGQKPFWNAFFNTFYIGIFQMLIAIPLGFIIASMINTSKWGRNLFKVLFFLPHVTSIVAAAMVFSFVLHPEMGMLNFVLDKLGLPTSTWLAEPTSAKWGVILLGVWHSLGFIVIICLANLQAISSELYEAAEIDGASGFQQWLFITIPNMGGTFAFLVVTGWIGAMQRFSDVFVIGGPGGSPNRSLQTMVGYIYERGFTGFEFGIASAATYVLFVIILLFTLVNLKLTRLKI